MNNFHIYRYIDKYTKETNDISNEEEIIEDINLNTVLIEDI